MTNQPTKLILDGDINEEVAGHISHLLNEHQVKIAIEAGDLKNAANLIPTPDILAIAVSIASVLSFFLKAVEVWRNTPKPELTTPQKGLEIRLNDELRAFKAEGFEVLHIQQLRSTAGQPPDKFVVAIYDVPGKQTIVLEASSDYHVRIERKKKS